MTAGALSQRLAKAEKALGKPLFLRTSSGLRPTEICAKVTPRLTRAITDLSEVVSDIRTVISTVLTVSVAPIFASRWLIWRIRKFNEQNPTISLRVVPTVDLDRSDVDVGIRVSENPAMGIGAVKLLDQRVFPVCSSEVAKDIKTPADLLKLPVIRENERLYGWDAWLAECGISTPALKPGPTYADASLCLDAVMTGQGIFMAWEPLLAMHWNEATWYLRFLSGPSLVPNTGLRQVGWRRENRASGSSERGSKTNSNAQSGIGMTQGHRLGQNTAFEYLPR